MKTSRWLGLSLLTAGLAGSALGADVPSAPRERLSFNAEWRFIKDDPAGAADKLSFANLKPWFNATGAGFSTNAQPAARPVGNIGADVVYTQPGFNDAGWRKLNLPHDWGIEGPFKQEYPGDTGKLPWWGVGWYRKPFTVPAGDQGRRLHLEVDGAMAYANVWLNGQYVGGWPYGYSSWQVDLTPYVKFGAENVIAIRLDNPPQSSRWYPGGGIYRNVWLTKTSPIHVAQWGAFVTTPQVSKESAKVEVKIALNNHSTVEANIVAQTEVFEIGGNGEKGRRPVASSMPIMAVVGPGQAGKGALELTVRMPKLWSIAKPNLYVAVTTVQQGDKAVDRQETIFGIRTIQFAADNGFLLNGERVPLNGVCNHHDLGALGAAINTRALERQLEILRAMGCNAIRTSHNPPAPELLDLCDRMGFLVIDEAFDCWAATKQRQSRADYARLFPDWHEKDTRALVRRDRNHPSVILWSTGNEIGEQGNPAGHAIGAQLARIVREEDPTRLVTAGCNNIQAGYNGFQKVVDAFGYNYKPNEYPKFHQANPALPIYSSESSSCVSSRGEYFFPVGDNKAGGKADFQMSSYDLYAPPWAWPPDVEFKGLDQAPYTAGEFVWTGFDYLGEPTPYNADLSNLLNFTDPVEKAKMEKELSELGRIRVPSRSSYFGIIDLAGFPKDRYYIYQARWRPDFPMAHILPHWNWPDRVGQVTPVHVYTSGDEAELFLNGKSLGRQKRGEFQYRFRWNEVVYEPGELKVVAYRNGKRWATDVMKTTGPATKLTLKPDRDQIRADGHDLSFITLTVADKDGLLVPRSKNQIKFSVEGPGEIVATDNGDATSFESFQSPERKAYNGLALVVVRAKAGESGAITLKAQSEGLKESTVRIRSQRAN